MGNCGKLWEIVRYCAFSKHLITSQNLSKPLITPISTRPVCVPHSVMLRLCSLKRFCLHEGIGNRSTVSSPHTPQPLRTHFPSGFSATVSTKLLRLRSRGDCFWQSFRSLAAYCSPSAHPRNFCCSAFALNGQKYIRMRAARSAATASHPCVEYTTVDIKNVACICSAVCVPHSVMHCKKAGCAVCASVIQSVMPVACKMCFYGRLWEIVGDCAFSKPLKTSQKFPKILIIPGSTRPVCMPHSVTLQLCRALQFIQKA